MSTVHHKIIAKEIVDRSRRYYEKQRSNLITKKPHNCDQEKMREQSTIFEPTISFFKVFSETVGQKTRPSVNINLKENPRIISLTKQRTGQSKENNNEPTQIQAQEEPSKYKPTLKFQEVFSEIIGKKTRLGKSIECTT